MKAHSIFKFLFLVFICNSFAQNYIVFENNKKNKALFDYNDPNSLVSMLVQNRDKIISSMGDNGYTKINEYSLHPTEGMPSISVWGQKWEIEGDDENVTSKILTRDSKDESFEAWYNRLTTGEDKDIYAPLTRTNKHDLQKQYEKCGDNHPISFPNETVYYDLNHIDMIITDSNDIYFARKSPYENKHFICLQLKLEELNNLERVDYLNESISKTVISKIREYQLQKMAIDTTEWPSYCLEEYYQYLNYLNQGSLFSDFEEEDFKYYRKNGSIKKIIPGSVWQIEGDDEDKTIKILIRESKNESFEDWFKRITESTDSIQQEIYAPLLRLDETGKISKATLKAQYELIGENQVIKFPDYEAIYWVDYPDPAIYLKRSFWKDSNGKFNTNFSQLLFAERLNTKNGYTQKPQVVMAFGSSNQDEKIPQGILDLLKPELALFDLKMEFPWRKIISANKGKKINNEELKKIIHCSEIDETGIQY